MTKDEEANANLFLLLLLLLASNKILYYSFYFFIPDADNFIDHQKFPFKMKFLL
jgi:hypothetical protein